MTAVPTWARLVAIALTSGFLGSCTAPGASTYQAPSDGAVRLPGSTARPASGPVRPGWLSAEAKHGKKLLYVSSGGNGSTPSAVYIYHISGQDQRPIGMLSSGISAVQGIAVDLQGNVYAANSGNSTVTEYPPGQTNPSTTYTNGVGSPYDVKVGTDGTVYVANTTGGPSGVGSVTEYPAGNTTPSATLALAGEVPTAVALDAGNNLYVAWFSPTTYADQVYKYAPGSTTGTNLNLDLPAGAFPLYGLAFDRSGNLVLWYETLDHSTKYLAAFPPAATEPKLRILGGSFLSNVFGIAYTRAGGGVYVASPNVNECVHMTYPGGIPNDVISLGFASGVAFSPGV